MNDLKFGGLGMAEGLLDPDDTSSVIELRGELVMLAPDVAKAFGVETRQVVQNIKANPIKLPRRYAFELTEREVERLRSSGMIPKAGRGGSCALPWALTQKGVIRLATIMESPKALEATDLVIDIFTEVIVQVIEGKQAVTLSNPSRLAGPEDAVALEKVRKQIVKAIDNLIFERRQADLAGAALDRERKAVDNFAKKIEIVERLLGMMDRLEPNAVVRLLPSFSAGQKRLPSLGPD